MSRRNRNRHKTSPERLLALRELAARFDLAVDDERLALINQSLTSAAWTKIHGGRNGEWPEFSGDALWDRAVFELVTETFPHIRQALLVEGYRMQLKAGRVQTGIANTCGISELVLIPEGYEPTQHRQKLETRAVLEGGALEAFIGTIGTWSVRDAIELAKHLMQPVLAEMRPNTADHVADRGRRFSGFSLEQLGGYIRLKLYATREILKARNVLTLKGAHEARERVLSIYSLATIARGLLHLSSSITDRQAMERLLAVAGRDRKLDPATKKALVAAVSAAARTIEGERGYLTSQQPPLPMADEAEAHLRTRLNGAGPAEFISFSHGGGETRQIKIECRIKGRILGRGIAPTTAEARAKAARAALINPELEEVLDDH